MIFRFQKVLTGLELSATFVKMAQVVKEKKGWRLIGCAEVPMPPGVLDLSYRRKNIEDLPGFLDTLKEALKYADGRVSRLGLSLPSEIVKVSVHKFEDLPKEKKSIEKFVLWRERERLPFPVEEAKFSYETVSPYSGGSQRLLVAVGSRDIIREYETSLKSLGIDPEVVQPSAINHLNFYMDGLVLDGVTSFLGLFENYFTFFVFEKEQLVFYRGKRRPLSIVHAIQEINLTVEFYHSQNPDKRVEKIFLGNQAKPAHGLETDMPGDFGIQLSVMDEEALVFRDGGLNDQAGAIDLAGYASAIGAAQSLAG